MKTPTINSRILKLEVLKGTATRTSVNAVESRTTSLESDVATAQGDISTLKGDVATLTQGIVDAVSTHNTAPDAHADIRTVIAGKQDSLTISDVGEAMLALATPSGQKIPRVNADGSVVLINVPSGDGVGGSSWYASDDGPPSVDISLSWVSDGDANGVFRALGTESGAWSNPASSGRIRSLASSIYEGYEGAVELLTDRTTTDTPTNNVANSWFAFDLGVGTTLALDSYSLQGRGVYSDHRPRTWVIQGSNDVSDWTSVGISAATWTTIDSRTGDPTISGTGVWGHWAASVRSAPYRFIRIMQTGANSSGANYLCLGEVELYGLVSALVAKPAGATGWARNSELIDDATAWMPYYATSALTDGTPIFGTAYDVASAVSTHNTAPDSHADLRTLIGDRALSMHQHARTDLPWISDPGAALLTAESASAQRTALGMTAWAVAPWTDGTTSDIPEGTQLYFTNARADARIAAQKGQAEGLAPLDAGGKVPSANLPDSIAQADDAARLGGQLPSYYAQASHVHTFAGLTSKPTTLAGYGITDAAAASHTHSGYETAIGNPSANGYLLSSTSAGVRSWVAPYSHPATHAQSVIDSSSGWVTTALAGKQAAGSYLTTTGTAADSAKLGGVAASGYSQTGHVHNYAGSSSPGGAATTALACTGNAATATALATPRTLTIGSKANTFDGTADKTWSLADIGAASTAALTTEATTRVTNDNAIWAALYAEQTGGTTCEIPLAATGDGSGVLTLRLWSDVANTATLSNGAFYGEIGGTTNLGQSVAMTAGQYTTFYIKLPSGSTATMSVLYGWALTRWGQFGTEFVVEATNAPKLNGLNTKYIPANVTAIRIYTNLNAGVVAGTTYPWASATYIVFYGNSMTISGTTYPWASATYIQFSGYSMTLSGTTYQWIAATSIFFNGNSMTISGTTYPWASATYIFFQGNSMTLSGTTYQWTSATQILFSGNSMTLSGTTYPWSSATQILFYGNSMTISGTTYPWASATYIHFNGNSMTLTANLSTSCLTTGNLNVYLSGTGIAVTYTTTRLWPTTMRQVYLRPSVGSMPTADTDRLFIDVDATCTTASSEKLLDVRGSCGAVTAASSAARASLVAKGFTVSFNS